MGVDAMIRGLDELTAQDLRERGSLKWTAHGGDMIGAFVAEMDFGPPPAVTRALHTAVTRGHVGYLPPWLATEVAEACAQWQLHRYGWRVAPEMIKPVADVLTAFELVVRHYTRPNSPIVLPTPAYMPFLTVPSLLGRRVIQVPMIRDAGRYVLDLDAIDRAFAAGGHLLVLCNPANPVGRVLTVDELTAVTEVVERHGGRVFADEIHAPLTYPGHRHVPYASTSPTAAAHSITATSASKGWNLAGLKCAQVILTAPGDVATWQRVGTTGSALASPLGAAATVAAYRYGGPWLQEVLHYLDRNRRALLDLLPEEVGYTPPEGTYLAWLDLRPLGLGEEPGVFLREQAGVATVEGAECGEAGRGHVRLNFATPLPILECAVTRILHALARRAPHLPRRRHSTRPRGGGTVSG
ncbi:MAG: aminotransferase class I/II-fold pyridoxal phosphate-dependent enzyme [Micromonosporaceae bacterium]